MDIHGITKAMVKKLTDEEQQRVTDLNKVWDYLYRSEEFRLCDYISREIGVIKGTLGYNDYVL